MTWLRTVYLGVPRSCYRIVSLNADRGDTLLARR